MKKKLLTILFSIFIFGAYAQEFEVPKNYVLEKAGDYVMQILELLTM